MRKTTEEILSDQENLRGTKGARERAKEFLKDQLSKGPVAQEEIRKQAEDEDFSWRTVQAAKRELKIESRREGGQIGKWYWKLPENKEEPEERETTSENENISENPKESKEPEAEEKSKKEQMSPQELRRMVDRIKAAGLIKKG